MKEDLPPSIVAFFRAHNTGETQNLNELFATDAVVNDEEHEHRGPAIKDWLDGAIAKYQPKAEVVDLARSGESVVVTARVSGTFPGSPTQLRYSFTLRNDKIAALSIEA
jgi:hypothetical protein